MVERKYTPFKFHIQTKFRNGNIYQGNDMAYHIYKYSNVLYCCWESCMYTYKEATNILCIPCWKYWIDIWDLINYFRTNIQ